LKRFLERFISARYWMLPSYVSIYYVQLFINANTPILRTLKGTLLVILILLLVVAVLANRMWAEHFRERIFGGLKFMIENDVSVDEKVVLEQHRWAGAQLLGVIVIILTILWQLSDVGKFGEANIVPVLVTGLVILVALFDAALDLSAEQAICLLAITKNPKEEAIGKLFYHTNQRSEFRKGLYRELVDKESDLHKAIINNTPLYLSYKTFSGQAQNIISISVTIVFFISAMTIFQLFKQFRVLLQ